MYGTNNALNGIQLQAFSARVDVEVLAHDRNCCVRENVGGIFIGLLSTECNPRALVEGMSAGEGGGSRSSPNITDENTGARGSSVCARFLNPASKSLSPARTAKTILSRGSPRDVVPLSPRAISIYSLLDFSQKPPADVFLR